eukprot:2374247-Karenia_brevis.AAC.1
MSQVLAAIPHDKRECQCEVCKCRLAAANGPATVSIGTPTPKKRRSNSISPTASMERDDWEIDARRRQRAIEQAAKEHRDSEMGQEARNVERKKATTGAKY